MAAVASSSSAFGKGLLLVVSIIVAVAPFSASQLIPSVLVQVDPTVTATYSNGADFGIRTTSIVSLPLGIPLPPLVTCNFYIQQSTDATFSVVSGPRLCETSVSVNTLLTTYAAGPAVQCRSLSPGSWYQATVSGSNCPTSTTSFLTPGDCVLSSLNIACSNDTISFTCTSGRTIHITVRRAVAWASTIIRYATYATTSYYNQTSPVAVDLQPGDMVSLVGVSTAASNWTTLSMCAPPFMVTDDMLATPLPTPTPEPDLDPSDITYYEGWLMDMYGAATDSRQAKHAPIYKSMFVSTINVQGSTGQAIYTSGKSTDFFVHYTGFFVPAQNGSYVFRINIDDGARLYFDDRVNGPQVVVDCDFMGASTCTQSTNITLTAGKYYRFEAEFQQGSWSYKMILSYSRNGGAFIVVPSTELYRPQDPTVQGVLADVYLRDQSDSSFDLWRGNTLLVSQCVNRAFFWNSDGNALTGGGGLIYGFPWTSATSTRTEYVVLRFQSFFTPPLNTSYTFRLDHDDGVRMMLDARDGGGSRVLIDKWSGTFNGQTMSAALNLTAGVKYYVQLEYMQQDTKSQLSLLYSNNSGATWRNMTSEMSIPSYFTDCRAPPTPTPVGPSATPTPTPVAVCGVAPEGGSVFLGCPPGQIISSIVTASFGTPGGGCASGITVNPACSAVTSSIMADAICTGKRNCSVFADQFTFLENPCPGVNKSLAIWAQCGMKACATVSTPSSNVLLRTFNNYADTAVSVLWCALDGTDLYRTRLRPGQSWTSLTYAGYAYAVTNALTGDVMAQPTMAVSGPSSVDITLVKYCTAPSPFSILPAWVRFCNYRTRPIKLFWCNSQTADVYKDVVAPGYCSNQLTWSGHIWEAVDAATNTLVRQGTVYCLIGPCTYRIS